MAQKHNKKVFKSLLSNRKVKSKRDTATLSKQQELVVNITRLSETELNTINGKDIKDCISKQNESVEPKTPIKNIEFALELKKAINERNILTTRSKTRLFNALELTNLGNDDIKCKSEMNRSNKEKTIMEIINSEKTYIQQLEILINYFMKPINEKHLLKLREYDIVFGNIMSIYYINKELLDELNVGPHNLTNGFMKLSSYFKIYSGYACQFKDRIKILENSKTCNSALAEFVRNQESRPEVQNKLAALLITPIQRIPRYKLLLVQLQSFCDPNNRNDKCFANLQECIDKVENAAIDINRVIGEQEHALKLLEFQKYLKTGEPNIIRPDRKLLKEGILKQMAKNDSGKPNEKLYVVLTNDIIIFNKMKKSNQLAVNSLKILYIFPLNKCIVIEVLDKGCLRVQCQEEELILYHDEFSEIKSWSECLQEAIKVYLGNRKTLRKESSGRVAVKRKHINMYHENGLSPGKPMRKRKYTDIEQSGSSTSTGTASSCSTSSTVLTRRKPIHSLITHRRDQLRSNPETNHLNVVGFPMFQQHIETDNAAVPSNTQYIESNPITTIATLSEPPPNDNLLKKVGTSIMGWFGLTKK